MEIEILVFEIDGHSFGVRSSDVQEVVRAATLTRMPNAPDSVEGVLNLRGRVLPVLNTRWLLGLEPRAIHHTDHLIVVRAVTHQVALRVDRAVDLVKFSPDDAQDPSGDHAGGRLIDMIGKTSEGLVYVIETQRLLLAGETEKIANSVAGTSAREVKA